MDDNTQLHAAHLAAYLFNRVENYDSLLNMRIVKKVHGITFMGYYIHDFLFLIILKSQLHIE